jgi:hypothetical protein
MSRQETANQWLRRVICASNNPQAKTMASFAITEWANLTRSWKIRGVKTRRSLWDLIAGVFECHNNITHHTYMTPICSGTEVFYFPVFYEAVGRRAKHLSAARGAIVSGVPMKSERLPQIGKWGNIVCKT